MDMIDYVIKDDMKDTTSNFEDIIISNMHRDWLRFFFVFLLLFIIG